MCDIEEWRPVVGYEGLYEVSSCGRVRSLDRVVERKTRWGTPGEMKVKGGVRATRLGPHGYPQVRLWKDGREKSLTVHRLVAEAFLGSPPEDRPLVLHADDTRDNNCVTNLRYGSYAENHRDRIRNGNMSVGNNTELWASQQKYAAVCSYATRLMREMIRADIPLPEPTELDVLLMGTEQILEATA